MDSSEHLHKHYLESLLWDEDSPVFEKETVFQQLMMTYSCAIKEVQTKLEVLNADLSARYRRNPIEVIKSRIKTPVSIAKKLEKLQVPVCVESISENLNDVAGIRVVCSFIDDIYTIAEMLTSQDDINLITVKDYIQNPKKNGYRSLHLILEVPVFFAEEKKPMRVEVQIRTIAMDFWASLDHHLRYKQDIGEADAQSIEEQLSQCAQVISDTDKEMLKIRNRIFKTDTVREKKSKT